MRRFLLPALVLLVFSSGLNAQEPFSRLTNLLDLDASLNAVNSDPVLQQRLLQDQRMVIFTGTVASRRVINGDEKDFVGELELIDGEWQGTESVAMYKSYLRLVGSDYVGAIPERRSREKNPKEIELNTRFLVIGEIVDLRREDDGVFPVLRVHYLREI